MRQTQDAAVSRLSSAVGRRFAHTKLEHPCICGKFVTDADLSRIQRMKEQLYEAAAEVHNKQWWHAQDSARRTNKALLRELSDKVCRRSSGDPTWEWARKSQLRHDFLKLTGYLTLLNLAGTLCHNALSVWHETSEA